MNKFRRVNHTFDRWGERFGHLIDPDHFLGRSSLDMPYGKNYTPPTNIKKREKVYEIELIIPGFQKEDIDIFLEGSILKVHGKRSYPNETVVDIMVSEYDVDSFARNYKLSPEIVDADISAKYENGILCISFFSMRQEQNNKQLIEVS